MNTRPVLIGALFVSLALNVFIGGAFVGAQLTEAKSQRPPIAEGEPGQRNPVAVAVRELSLDRQAAWRAETPAYAQTYGPKVREARQLVRATLRGLGDEPFDAETAMATLARARALELEGRTAMDRRLVTFAATLPQSERRAFGEALARPRLGRGGGSGGGDGGRVALPDR